MSLKLYSGPAGEPVLLSEAKQHLRVDISTDDTYIEALIKVARETCETITRRALISQTWDMVLDEFPALDWISFPFPPLQSVTSVSYTTLAGVTSTVSSSTYVVDTYSEPGRLRLKSGYAWPGDSLKELAGVTIRFVCGYGLIRTSVPESIRQAMLLLIGHYYENREQVVIGQGVSIQKLPQGFEALLWPYRLVSF
jgi:uncharacterized phiE125 gp8 family phage protein